MPYEVDSGQIHGPDILLFSAVHYMNFFWLGHLYSLWLFKIASQMMREFFQKKKFIDACFISVWNFFVQNQKPQNWLWRAHDNTRRPQVIFFIGANWK